MTKRSAGDRRGLSGPHRLGRVFSVRRETWRLDQDPSRERPEVTVLASRRSAAEAADLARAAAAVFERRGFHKATGSWWGVAAGRFHRFRVVGPTRRAGLVAAGLGVLAAAVLIGRRRQARRSAPPGVKTGLGAASQGATQTAPHKGAASASEPRQGADILEA
ncbi:hypothetical protein LRS10_01495 [Phenylobacterium sp. J426]|uniref:hypothetical protein n=1 Tax=Phenylobacterium sp. J426 TaxID=2898439 RepID=UPI002150CD5B|nr:hypothetical protein [Phenylobacterium sp. J426]MCR5872986.1 hypothetical protein [Phenylobacterium sp. J426]